MKERKTNWKTFWKWVGWITLSIVSFPFFWVVVAIKLIIGKDEKEEEDNGETTKE